SWTDLGVTSSVLLVVFALVSAEFSDVDSGGRVPVRNAVIQRVLVDCLEGKLPPGTAAGPVCAVGARGHLLVKNSPSTTPRCCVVVCLRSLSSRFDQLVSPRLSSIPSCGRLFVVLCATAAAAADSPCFRRVAALVVSTAPVAERFSSVVASRAERRRVGRSHGDGC